MWDTIGQSRDDHRHDGREAEEDEVLDSNKGSGFAAPRQPHTARDEQQCVGEVVAHHKVKKPPAGEDDGGSGQEDEGPNRTGSSLSNRRSSVSKEDGKRKDEAEPVRLGQHRAHPQEGISRRQGHPEEEIVPPILHIQDLPDLDDKARQQHQQGRQDAEHLTEG